MTRWPRLEPLDLLAYLLDNPGHIRTGDVG
jgi:hypothetical protein